MHTLLSAAEMQAVDARAVAAGADGFALMRRAGQAVARHVRRRLSRGRPVLVLAGGGNNGGDGAIAAGALLDAGHDVTLLRIGAAREGSDAARAFALWHGPTLHVDASAPALVPEVMAGIGRAALIVDALLGAGLSRELDGRFADLVRAMDAAAADIVAVDLPSGLDGDDHRVRGVAARATLTVTFVRLKPAHCLQPGRALCGQIVLEDIGMPAAALADAPRDCRLNDPAIWRDALPVPEVETHKFRRGHAVVRAGAAHRTGAARLSAGAALHAGAGLVTLAAPEAAVAVCAAHLSAVMLAPCDARGEAWRALIDDARVSAVLVGPGNGVDAATRRDLDAALASGHPCVLDADALSLGGDAPERFVETLRGARGALVLTPHDGEFGRLFGHTDILALPSRLHRARAGAALLGAVLVSKGADTVVAAPDGRATIAVNAPPWLATAGAGDVLAGVIAALLAQGMAPFEAACAAVWAHGEAARGLGWPLSAEMLVPAVGRALGAVAAFAPPPRPRLPRAPLSLPGATASPGEHGV